MDRFRYDTSGSWYKGNTHIHSTASDGGKTFPELAQMYRGAGYDFLFRTDHWVASDVDGDGGAGNGLLWLDGIELNGPDDRGSEYHVVCLGRFEGLTESMGLNAGMDAARGQGGLLILAHPHWTGNSLEDVLAYPFDGVEVYNHVCRWLNGKSEGGVHWSAALDQRPNTLGFAVDDAHLRVGQPSWNGGWIQVNAGECSPEAVIAAIRAGNFYSSCAPAIHAIELVGNSVRVETSPARYVRLAGSAWLGRRVGADDGSLITEAEIEIPDDWPYAYLEVEDEYGRRAWTNTLFVADE